MTNWKKYILVAVIVTAAGFGYIKSSHRNIPSDLRDAVADNGKFDTSIPVFDKDSGSIPEPTAVAVKGINEGYVAGNAPSAGAPTQPVGFYKNQVIAALVAERILAANGVHALTRLSTGGGEIMRDGEDKYRKVVRGAHGLIDTIMMDVAGTATIMGGRIPKIFGEVNQEFLDYVSRATPIGFSASPRCSNISPKDYERGIMELRREYQHASEIGKKEMFQTISSMELKAFEEIAAGQ